MLDCDDHQSCWEVELPWNDTHAVDVATFCCFEESLQVPDFPIPQIQHTQRSEEHLLT